MVENYTAVHRAFLQSCARNSVFSVPMALNVLASIQSKRKFFFNKIRFFDVFHKIY